MTSYRWMILLVYAALVVPQIILGFRGRRRLWAQILSVAGACLMAYAFWVELGGVEALRNPYVYVGLAIGTALPFAFAWFARRAKRSTETACVDDTLPDDA